MWTEKERIEQEKVAAKADLTKLEAMKILISNNDLGAELNVAGIVVGVSMNERLLPVIEAEIEEIEKYLNGKPNNYE